jgi:hypothetical protein
MANYRINTNTNSNNIRAHDKTNKKQTKGTKREENVSI